MESIQKHHRKLNSLSHYMTTPEIEELKLLMEQKYGKALSTTTDFEEFSIYLKQKTDKNISASTLKRLYGYVKDDHKPRIVTLDVLAQYIGHKSYKDFTTWLKRSSKYNSSFFRADQLISSDLSEGNEIAIGWSPNRLLTLSYHGESLYEVIHSENSKLKVGDKFVTGCFIKEQPLYLPYIERNGEHTAPFVAGRNGGLTIINIIKS